MAKTGLVRTKDNNGYDAQRAAAYILANYDKLLAEEKLAVLFCSPFIIFTFHYFHFNQPNPFKFIPFQSIPIHSNPLHSNPFQSNPIQPIPIQSNPKRKLGPKGNEIDEKEVQQVMQKLKEKVGISKNYRMDGDSNRGFKRRFATWKDLIS